MGMTVGQTAPIKIELLAPARNAEIAMAAIDYGADAVYMGAPSHGARRQAANSTDDIKRVVEYAHRFGVRVYVTVNTIIYDDELADVQQLVWTLYRIGVDALIVQDMALLKMQLPPIALHASTQCDIRTPQKARFLQDVGFSQLVLPRELTLAEIKEFRRAVSVPLEAFVHGALCVCYSGDCQASYVVTGRSANRGECAQICRYRFNLEDAEGNTLLEGKHLLSLKDMNRIEHLSEMLQAGITSFKIEGRLKDAAYVKNVVAAYSDALNKIVAAGNGKYSRTSRGTSVHSFIPDLAKSFNRGYTSYFLKSEHPAEGLGALDSPKWIGERVGKVLRILGSRTVKAKLYVPLTNGDGLGFFNPSGEFVGFRLNRVDGGLLVSASDVSLPIGTVLYRNSDKSWADLIERATAHRVISVDMALRWCCGQLILEICDEDGMTAAAAMAFEPQVAKTPQTETRKRTLAKLGGTEFRLNACSDTLGDGLFVPTSMLASLRRDAVEALRAAYAATYPFPKRLEPSEHCAISDDVSLSRHDNVANHLAAAFYAQARGTTVADVPRAIEVLPQTHAETRVMQTRYCLRRELGACLKSPAARKLPSPLFVTSGNTRFRLDFDCAACRMNVIAVV